MIDDLTPDAQDEHDVLRMMPPAHAARGLDERHIARCLDEVHRMRTAAVLLAAFDAGEIVPRVIRGRVQWVARECDPLLREKRRAKR